jgi:hypothetical protein
VTPGVEAGDGATGVVVVTSALGCATAGCASSAEKAAVTSEMVSRVVITVSFMDFLSVLRDGVGIYSNQV